MRLWNALASTATLPFKQDKHAQLEYIKYYLGITQIVHETDGTSWSINPKWSPSILKADDYEQEAGRWLKSHFIKGEVFADVGANVGRYSIRAAKAGMIVYAFEPIPTNLEGLKENVKLNAAKINIIPIALGDINKSVLMKRSFSESKLDPNGDIRVQMMMLDFYDIHPKLIKIDVEGKEKDVLLGARKTIETCHPTIFLELHISMMTPEEAKSVRVLLQDFGYSLTTVRSRPLVEHLVAEFH